MRLAILAVGLLLALVLLLPLLRRFRLPARPRASCLTDELVKDPVCQTYVVRSRAVSRETPAGLRYFCSAECARLDSGG